MNYDGEFKILIRNSTTQTYTFATWKVPETVDETDINGNTVSIPTGNYVTEYFHTKDPEVAKEKYIELLKSYHEEDLNIILDTTEEVTITVTIKENVPSV